MRATGGETDLLKAEDMQVRMGVTKHEVLRIREARDRISIWCAAWVLIWPAEDLGQV
jgi:hypothetical protein